MKTKWLSCQGDPLQVHLHVANQEKNICETFQWLILWLNFRGLIYGQNFRGPILVETSQNFRAKISWPQSTCQLLTCRLYLQHLKALTLVGSTRNNLVLDPLAALHLNNQLYITENLSSKNLTGVWRGGVEWPFYVRRRLMWRKIIREQR